MNKENRPTKGKIWIGRAKGPFHAILVSQMAADYLREIGNPDYLQFDEDTVYDAMLHAWQRGDRPCVLMMDGQQPCAFGAYELDDFWSVKPIANIYMLYVRPQWRGRGLGRVLVKIMTDMIKGDGAGVVYANVISDFSQSRTATNTFQRSGFEPLERTMRKVL